MARIKTLTLRAGPAGVVQADTEIEVSEEQARAEIEAGTAVAVDESPDVPEREAPVETATAPEGEQATTRSGRAHRRRRG